MWKLIYIYGNYISVTWESKSNLYFGKLIIIYLYSYSKYSFNIYNTATSFL